MGAIQFTLQFTIRHYEWKGTYHEQGKVQKSTNWTCACSNKVPTYNLLYPKCDTSGLFAKEEKNRQKSTMIE